MPDLIKVIIVDDHQLVRDSFRRAFSEEEGFAIVYELASADLAQQACRTYEPDLVLMDVCTDQDASGLAAIVPIKQEMPQIKIIIMSGFDEISYAPRAQQLGADAFIFKSKSLEYFLSTAKAVIKGERVFPEPSRIAMPNGVAPFTARELEILRLFCMHKSRFEIADELVISRSTLKRHVENMLNKSGFSSLVELIIYVVANGWINPKY